MAVDFHRDGVPLVRLAGLGGHEVSLRKCNYLDPEKVAKRWAHFRLERGDILISTSASFGRPAVVGAEAEGAVAYTGIVRFRPSSNMLDAGFLKAFLGSKEFMRQADAAASGSVISHFGPSHLKRMEIPLPPVKVQQEIAEVQQALDDKIELNRRMNETLEAMAQAIFRDWFVDFGPVRRKLAGETDPIRIMGGLTPDPVRATELAALFPEGLNNAGLPQGWLRTDMQQFSTVKYGAPFQSSRFNSNGVGRPLIRIRDLQSHSSDVFSDEVLPREYVIQPGDIVVGMDGEFRAYLWQGVPSLMNQRVCSFCPSAPSLRGLVLFSLMPQLAAAEASAVGTTVIHLGKKDIDRFSMVDGGAEIAAQFGDLVEPLLDRIVLAGSESRSLAETRNYLLPRLMSGQVRVAEAAEMAAA